MKMKAEKDKKRKKKKRPSDTPVWCELRGLLRSPPGVGSRGPACDGYLRHCTCLSAAGSPDPRMCHRVTRTPSCACGFES